MKQTILFLRNGSLYANKTEAIRGLNSVTHKAGQPVIALYGTAGSVELIMAIGTEDGEYKILQECLVDGINIKTINGSSILGEGNLDVGNIESVDIGYEVEDSDVINYSKSVVLLTGDIVNLTPNIYYKKTDIVASLTINLDTKINESILNEYIIEFTTSSEGTSVILPNDIKWVGGQIPVFEDNQTYQISIINNLGVCAKYS